MAAVVAACAAGAACVAFGGVAVLAYAGHDRVELLDRPDVVDAAGSACGAVSAALGSGAPDDRGGRLAAGHAVIEQLVATMTALGPDVLGDDRPAEGWIADWQALDAARQDLGLALATDPQAELVVPRTADGEPVTLRMGVAGGPECERAVALAAAP